ARGRHAPSAQGDELRLIDVEDGTVTAFDPPVPARGVSGEVASDRRSAAVRLPNGRVRVIALAGGERQAEWDNPGDEAELIGFNPDSKLLAVWVRRGAVWALELSAPAGRGRRAVLADQPAAGAVRFTPGGRLF